MAGLLAFSFSAGLIAAFNPCGFAMLPAFVGYYLGLDDNARRSALARLGDGLMLGASVTLGFVLVFAAIGLLVSLGGNGILFFFSEIVLAIGLALVALGAWLAAGRHLNFVLATRVAVMGGRGPRAGLVYGLGFGLASLACTLPVFLVVVGSAFSADGVLSGLALFVAYSVGMGTVVTAVALSASLFKGAVTRWLRRLLPLVQQASGALLVGAGIYLVVRELDSDRIGRSGFVELLADNAALVTSGLVALAALLVLLTWWLAPREDEASQTSLALQLRGSAARRDAR